MVTSVPVWSPAFGEKDTTRRRTPSGHGTVNRFLPSILESGLLPSGRTHVHLSDSIVTARDVGSRLGTPVILQIDAAEMHQAGALFYQSAHGGWLTDAVDPQFLTVSDSASERK